MTPMMQQYFDVKRGLPKDTLLLFRLGDFFELFFDDAVTVSKLLGLTLTKRQDTPMAGLPAQAVDNYVSKLLAAGKKVAICDQAEPAKAGKLVRRQLTRILSPGTTLAANQLDAARNHYLAAVALDSHGHEAPQDGDSLFPLDQIGEQPLCDVRLEAAVGVAALAGQGVLEAIENDPDAGFMEPPPDPVLTIRPDPASSGTTSSNLAKLATPPLRASTSTTRTPRRAMP